MRNAELGTWNLRRSNSIPHPHFRIKSKRTPLAHRVYTKRAHENAAVIVNRGVLAPLLVAIGYT